MLAVALFLRRTPLRMPLRTPLRMRLRAVGDTPAAVEAPGLSASALRMGAVVVGSGLLGIGGAFLAISAFLALFFGMADGRGWICIAPVVFGAWVPPMALLGASLFAGVDARKVRLQLEPSARWCPVRAC
jgi:simple sugar transport system permease protein